MAHYDRRILVPYLRDVCCAEFVCSRLEKQISQCQKEINRLKSASEQRVIDPTYPEESEYKIKQLDEDIPMVIIYGIVTLVGLAIGWNLLGIALMLGGGLFAGVSIWSIHDNYKERHRQYLLGIDRYKRIMNDNRRLREQIPKYKYALQKERERLTQLQCQLQNAKKLRNDVYGVNIIPARYRNIYAAYYLYDFFSTGRETDLERTIQTMLLDEIVQRLGVIIKQNEEIILNQRIQLAIQEQQNRAIAENHREQLRQIARVEKNQELQMDYQHMIVQNQRVTNFFLAADYLRNM